MRTTRTARDLAADSPLTYEQLHAAHKAGTLGAQLAALTPIQRVGAAAVVAERMGRDVSNVMFMFGREIEKYEAQVEQRPEDLDCCAGLDTETADELLTAPLTDDELIAQAGGLRANPFQVRERDGEILITDRRTGKYADSCDRLDARAHTMSAEARRLWLAELRAAQTATPAQSECDDTEGLERAERELAARCACFADATEHAACLAAGRCLDLNASQPDDDPTPPPAAPALAGCLVELPDGYAALDGGGRLLWTWQGTAEALRQFIASRAA